MLSTAKHDSNRTKKRRTRLDYGKNTMAASLGLEPRQRDPESLVLPLHHEASRTGKIMFDPLLATGSATGADHRTTGTMGPRLRRGYGGQATGPTPSAKTRD